MSATRSEDSTNAVSNQPGQFGSRIQPSEPLTTSGHKPGLQIGNDAAPEFHAKTLPPGTAPASRTFTPNTASEVPGQADNDAVLRSHGKESTQTTASSTLGGATSGDVHTGLGKPIQGQTSGEEKVGGGGLVGLASGAESGNQMVDERVDPRQRGLEKEGGALAGKKFSTDEGAEETPNVGSAELAAERD